MIMNPDQLVGYHSEWNLGSPGGWDYQRITQIIGKAVWVKLNEIRPMEVQVYTIARDTPIGSMNKVKLEELEPIASRIRKLGIGVSVFD